jgi:hypothetical protein
MFTMDWSFFLIIRKTMSTIQAKTIGNSELKLCRAIKTKKVNKKAKILKELAVDLTKFHCCLVCIELVGTRL